MPDSSDDRRLSMFPTAPRSRTSALPAHIRPLVATDRTRFAAHLLRLDAASRRLRFGGVVNEAFLVRYAERTLEGDALVLGLFVEGELRGAGELHRFGTGTEGEVAFSLEQGFQGAGHGACLLASLSRRARRLGLGRILFQCLAENRAMISLARRAGARLRFEGGEVDASLVLEALPALPVPASAALARAASRGVEALKRSAETGEPALG